MALSPEVTGLISRIQTYIRKDFEVNLAQFVIEGQLFPSRCAFANQLAKEAKGYMYGTDNSSLYGKFGHKVAIIRDSSGLSGSIVDVTFAEPLMGRVTNVTDFESTAAEIAQVYQVGGWEMWFNYSE
jgi:hypothetical protein